MCTELADEKAPPPEESAARAALPAASLFSNFEKTNDALTSLFVKFSYPISHVSLLYYVFRRSLMTSDRVTCLLLQPLPDASIWRVPPTRHSRPNRLYEDTFI